MAKIKNIQEAKQQLRSIRKRIARERDNLEKILTELEYLQGDTENAHTHLEYAIESLSNSQ